MMHKKNLVAAIKVGGKVLRESSDRVELPFGSEYSILLKNLDTVKMQAQVSIDGKDASGWLVVNPGQSLDLERFYRGNKDAGSRFKFIERTAAIENHRGIDAEDGLVRVEFKREKVYESPKITHHYHYDHWTHWPDRSVWPYRPYWYGGCFGQNNSFTITSSSLLKQSGNRGSSRSFNTISNTSGVSGGIIGAMNCSLAANITPTNNENGITVEGSISNQQFVLVPDFQCEASEVIVLHLVGRKAEKTVRVAKTVDLKQQCPTCGKKNKVAKFCKECGTNLEKV